MLWDKQVLHRVTVIYHFILTFVFKFYKDTKARVLSKFELEFDKNVRQQSLVVGEHMYICHKITITNYIFYIQALL